MVMCCLFSGKVRVNFDFFLGYDWILIFRFSKVVDLVMMVRFSLLFWFCVWLFSCLNFLKILLIFFFGMLILVF